MGVVIKVGRQEQERGHHGRDHARAVQAQAAAPDHGVAGEQQDRRRGVERRVERGEIG